jgi:hypothetical protein
MPSIGCCMGSDVAPGLRASSSGTPRRDLLSLITWWVLAWVATAALIAASHYGSGDPDSKLYAGISARMAALPVAQWIAPEWWGFWGLTGPYHEHPVGMFVVPAALARFGYPAGQAAYAVNALYQAASLLLIALIARSVVPRREADALGWIAQLLPIAFVFRIRANQEYAVLAGLLLALYACERARTRAAWVPGMLAGFVAVLLVKGVFAFMVPLTCGLWLLARGRVPRAGQGISPAEQPVGQGFSPAERPVGQGFSPAERPVGQGFSPAEERPVGQGFSPALPRVSEWPLAAWTGVLLLPVAGVLVTWAYESAYLQVTGRSFLEIYRARQVPEGALTAGSPVVRTAYNLAWYTARVAWFAFPWSLLGGAAAWTALRARRFWPPAAGSGPDHASARQGAWFAAAATMALVVAFSLAHRKADRYIFPAYFSAAALGGVYAIRRVPRLARVAEALDRAWVPPAIHVALVLLRLATRGALPEFTFWRS